MSRKDQTIQTKQAIQNQVGKFYQQVGEECVKIYQQPDEKEAKQFWSKIWERIEHNRKAEWINNMGKELQ